ncbi:MAG: hypothetical protein EPN82_15795 [Bacteroidetes bacterium]|nr:MAG: hypothetical protein EPN82_15795 [Bacteroidota bacterium]
MKIIILILLLLVWVSSMFSQDVLDKGKLSGNFQLDAQYYQKDSIIGAQDVKEKILSNGYLYLNYTAGNFSMGMRYETYLNPILGIDPRYKGSGIAYRFGEFRSEMIDVTAGNFYEQFGSGLIFRAYEERLLGYDNAVDGLRVKFRPKNGIELTGLIGNQRSFWDNGLGIVRGGSGRMEVNTVFPELLPFQSTVEGSLISKYQPDQESFYNLPENVLAWSGKLSINTEDFMVEGEYAYKCNDPDAVNKFNFNPGKALMLTASYYPSGFGASINFHTIDNMDFRSDRDARGNNLNLNFIPPLTKQHIYRLATLYPSATQLNGEIGFQAELTYTIPKKTFIGGDYGTTIALNYSQINSMDKTPLDVDSSDNHIYTYKSSFFKFGDVLYFRDINLEITRKWTKDFKSIFTLINLVYNKDVMENEGSGKYGKVNATIAVAELTYLISKTNSIKCELQYIWAKQDSVIKVPDNTNGNWFMFLAEYTIAPSWYFTAFDEYNYGNHDTGRKIHYLNGSFAFIYEATRVQFGYGRQRGGLLCVGGVCRPVPASNGFFLSVSSTF